MTQETGAVRGRGLRRMVVATFIGQVTEWYDYAIYALVASQIGAAFFPSQDKGAALLSAFAVFGVAFVARPLGGLLIGIYGDRHGRRSVLVISLALMAVASASVGVLPGADRIGLAAPALLVVARFLQGVSAAGESTSAITYVAESAPTERKGFFVALLLSGNSAGFLLATLIVWLAHEALGPTAFNDWGWRVPFLLALPLGLAGLYIRRHLAESPIFERLRDGGALSPTPLTDSVTTGIGQLFQAMGISALSFVANYLLVAYMPIHLEQAGASVREVSALGAVTTGTLLVSYPLMGALSDVIGRRSVMLAGAAFIALLGWPLFALTLSHDLGLRMGAVALLAISTAAFIACLGVYCTEFIDQSRLMTTYSIGFNLSGALFGGTSLWAFGKITQSTGDSRMAAAYLVAAAVLSFVTMLTIRPANRFTRRSGSTAPPSLRS